LEPLIQQQQPQQNHQNIFNQIAIDYISNSEEEADSEKEEYNIPTEINVQPNGQPTTPETGTIELTNRLAKLRSEYNVLIGPLRRKRLMQPQPNRTFEKSSEPEVPGYLEPLIQQQQPQHSGQSHFYVLDPQTIQPMYSMPQHPLYEEHQEKQSDQKPPLNFDTPVVPSMGLRTKIPGLSAINILKPTSSPYMHREGEFIRRSLTKHGKLPSYSQSLSRSRLEGNKESDQRLVVNEMVLDDTGKVLTQNVVNMPALSKVIDNLEKHLIRFLGYKNKIREVDRATYETQMKAAIYHNLDIAIKQCTNKKTKILGKKILEAFGFLLETENISEYTKNLKIMEIRKLNQLIEKNENSGDIWSM
jgi:hypothetical protein